VDRYPLPDTPDGWYVVGPGEALAAGEVRPVRYFGRDLVLFRGESGEPRLFDAHCPHLGAHLGVGGRVCGDGIRCPFHGWRFDGEGRLVEVPRLDRRPPDVRARTYPAAERAGHILAFYHAREETPGWEAPLPREEGVDWTEWTSESYEVRTHVQDVAENILDLPHFWSVHDMDAPEDKRFDVRFEGPNMIVEQTLKVTQGEGTGVEVMARTVNAGPGLSTTEVAFGGVRTLTFISHTPVEKDRLELQLHFCMKRMDDLRAAESIERLNRDFIRRQFEQDIPIWENKIYRERPPLTATDGPIPEYRRWYRQFYSGWDRESA